MERIARMRIRRRAVGALAEAGTVLLRSDAALRDREEVVAVERLRGHEAGGPLLAVLRGPGRSALGVVGVHDRAARRRAVEALDRAQRDRALQGVGLHVGVAALPVRPLEPAVEGAALDDADVGLVAVAAGVARDVRSAVLEEAGDGRLVEVEVAENGVELLEEGMQRV